MLLREETVQRLRTFAASKAAHHARQRVAPAERCARAVTHRCGARPDCCVHEGVPKHNADRLYEARAAAVLRLEQLVDRCCVHGRNRALVWAEAWPPDADHDEPGLYERAATSGPGE